MKASKICNFRLIILSFHSPFLSFSRILTVMDWLMSDVPLIDRAFIRSVGLNRVRTTTVSQVDYLASWYMSSRSPQKNYSCYSFWLAMPLSRWSQYVLGTPTGICRRWIRPHHYEEGSLFGHSLYWLLMMVLLFGRNSALTLSYKTGLRRTHIISLLSHMTKQLSQSLSNLPQNGVWSIDQHYSNMNTCMR